MQTKAQNFGYFLTLLCGLLIFQSCSKSENLGIVAEIESQKISTAVDKVDLDLTVSNNRIKFENIEEFRSTLAYLSDNEERFFTSEALDVWEFNMGFSSIRSAYEMAHDEFGEMKDESEFDNFKEKYSRVLNFTSDYKFEPMAFGIFSYLTEDEYSSFQIGDDIHIIKGNTQITFSSEMESQIDRIYQSPNSFDSKDVYVNQLVPEEDLSRAACPAGTTTLDCNDNNGSKNKSKRISGVFKLSKVFLGIKTFEGESVRAWDMFYNITIKSEVKKWWGWGRNKSDEIEFGTGWGVIYEIVTLNDCLLTTKEFCHGTGWSSVTHEINYSKLYDSIVVPLNCGNGSTLDHEYLYNNNFVQNNDVPELFCEDDCWNRGCNN